MKVYKRWRIKEPVSVRREHPPRLRPAWGYFIEADGRSLEIVHPAPDDEVVDETGGERII